MHRQSARPGHLTRSHTCRLSATPTTSWTTAMTRAHWVAARILRLPNHIEQYVKPQGRHDDWGAAARREPRELQRIAHAGYGHSPMFGDGGTRGPP